MMRVENKSRHLSDAFRRVPVRPMGRASKPPTPNRGINKARVSRHVRVPSVLINFSGLFIHKRGQFFSSYVTVYCTRDFSLVLISQYHKRFQGGSGGTEVSF